MAYALLDLSTLPTLHAARSLSVPLRGGPLALRLTLQQCAAMAAARDASAHGGKVGACTMKPPNLHAFNPSDALCADKKLYITPHCPVLCPAMQAAPRKPSAKTSLPLTLKPVPPQDTAAALLPRLALASAPVARVISLYRQLLAEALGVVSSPTGLTVGEGRQCWWSGPCLERITHCRQDAGDTTPQPTPMHCWPLPAGRCLPSACSGPGAGCLPCCAGRRGPQRSLHAVSTLLSPCL